MTEGTTRLKDSLLDIDTDTLTVHTGPRLTHEPQLKVDADLLARLLGELHASTSLSISC